MLNPSNRFPFGMILCVVAVTITIFFQPSFNNSSKSNAQQEAVVMPRPWPVGVLEFQVNQLLARKRNDGKWQLCRVKRFTWQEPQALLKTEPRSLMSEYDLADSRGPDGRGLYVIVQFCPLIFETKEITADAAALKSIIDADHTIIALEKFKSPDYVILK